MLFRSPSVSEIIAKVSYQFLHVISSDAGESVVLAAVNTLLVSFWFCTLPAADIFDTLLLLQLSCPLVLNVLITPRLTDLYAFRNKLTGSDRRKLLFLLKGSRFRSKELISYPGALELMLMA